MQQYFLSHAVAEGDWIELREDIRHHLDRVLRVREGSSIRLIDRQGQPYLASVHRKGRSLFALVTQTLQETRELPISLVLYIAMIKRDKWEYCLQKSTELGVTRIVGLPAARSVIRSVEDFTKRRDRYEKILQEAAEQSERHRIPELVFTDQLEEAARGQDLNYLCWERSEARSPHLLSDIEVRLSGLMPPASIGIYIGPEGGFTEEEVQQARAAGFLPVSLGSRILRAETAATAALTLLAAAIETKTAQAGREEHHASI